MQSREWGQNIFIRSLYATLFLLVKCNFMYQRDGRQWVQVHPISISEWPLQKMSGKLKNEVTLVKEKITWTSFTNALSWYVALTQLAYHLSVLIIARKCPHSILWIDTFNRIFTCFNVTKNYLFIMYPILILSIQYSLNHEAVWW